MFFVVIAEANNYTIAAVTLLTEWQIETVQRQFVPRCLLHKYKTYIESCLYRTSFGATSRVHFTIAFPFCSQLHQFSVASAALSQPLRLTLAALGQPTTRPFPIPLLSSGDYHHQSCLSCPCHFGPMFGSFSTTDNVFVLANAQRTGTTFQHIFKFRV